MDIMKLNDNEQLVKNLEYDGLINSENSVKFNPDAELYKEVILVYDNYIEIIGSDQDYTSEEARVKGLKAPNFFVHGEIIQNIDKIKTILINTTSDNNAFSIKIGDKKHGQIENRERLEEFVKNYTEILNGNCKSYKIISKGKICQSDSTDKIFQAIDHTGCIKLIKS